MLGVLVVAIVLPKLLHRPISRVVPLVVVQIFVGILCGPTLLEPFFPELYKQVADPTVNLIVKGAGNIAVLLFAVTIGMHLDFKQFSGNGKTKALTITAATSLFVPLILALPMGYYFGTFPELRGEQGTPQLFMMAFAIAASVTALPVLAATLNQMDYARTRVGTVSLVGAVANDGMLWILLALFITMVAAKSSGMSAVYSMLGCATIYGITMWYVVRPFLSRVECKSLETCLTVVVGVGMLSSLATHLIGLHALLGAVVAGMCVPDHLKHQTEKAMGVVNEYAFLPLFFVSTGMSAKIPLSADLLFWGLALGSTVLAIVGKLFPSAYVAHRTGLLTKREAFEFGSFMATKGLMEIVVLTIMRDERVISTQTFGALVVMALLTTAATVPLFKLCQRLIDHDNESEPVMVTEAVQQMVG